MSLVAEGDKGEVTRIKAPVHRNELQGVDHVGIGDADDTARDLNR